MGRSRGQERMSVVDWFWSEKCGYGVRVYTGSGSNKVEYGVSAIGESWGTNRSEGTINVRRLLSALFVSRHVPSADLNKVNIYKQSCGPVGPETDGFGEEFTIVCS